MQQVRSNFVSNSTSRKSACMKHRFPSTPSCLAAARMNASLSGVGSRAVTLADFASGSATCPHPEPMSSMRDPGEGVIGRSMVSVTEIAHAHGLLSIPDGILLRPQDAMGVPRDKVAILVSGTQGEPMSALSRVAVDNHKHISVDKGDTVVMSSRIIPGNEKAIFRMIDHMSRRGADVMYGSMNPPLHVSGHASVEEMKLVLNLVRPRYFMPIHGEFRQLSKHAKLAEH